MRRKIGRELERRVTVGDILSRLRRMADPEAVKGMARFGIKSENTLGIPMPAIRRLARDIGRDHALERRR